MRKKERLRGHIPNNFSIGERVRNTVLAVVLLAYGFYGLYVDDLYIPGKRGGGIHLHGIGAWVMYGALVCSAAIALALVIDHYDRRNNEHHYENFKSMASFVGWCFFGAALLGLIIPG